MLLLMLLSLSWFVVNTVINAVVNVVVIIVFVVAAAVVALFVEGLTCHQRLTAHRALPLASPLSSPPI